jgi:hypothetical protein
LALILALSHLFVVFLILLVLIAWGTRLLQPFRCESQSHLESLLFATGLSAGILDIILFGLAEQLTVRMPIYANWCHKNRQN